MIFAVFLELLCVKTFEYHKTCFICSKLPATVNQFNCVVSGLLSLILVPIYNLILGLFPIHSKIYYFVVVAYKVDSRLHVKHGKTAVAG